MSQWRELSERVAIAAVVVGVLLCAVDLRELAPGSGASADEAQRASVGTVLQDAERILLPLALRGASLDQLPPPHTAPPRTSTPPTRPTATSTGGPGPWPTPLPTQGPPKEGGTLVIGQGQEPDTLYLHSSFFSLAAHHVQSSLYDGPIDHLSYEYQPVILEELPLLEEEGSGAVLELVTVEEGQPYVDPEANEVVTATERVEDLPQLTVRFTILEGVTWEDGVPVSAADSVFSRELACHPDTPTGKFLCERTARYAAFDERTAEWQGLPGFADQTYFTNFYTPLPRHQVGADGTRMDETDPWLILQDEVFTRRPLSYGPFKIVEWEPGLHIRLEKNELYWRADEGLPYLDAVIYRFIPDSNELLRALESVDVDVATQDGLSIHHYRSLEEMWMRGLLVPYYIPGTVWEQIAFNLDPVDGRVPLGACRDVRKAIALGTDREALVQSTMRGQSHVLNSFLPQEHWAYPLDGLATHEYDRVAAEDLLAGLGFVDEDGDGFRTATRDITCTITVDGDGNTKEQLIPVGTPLELTLATTAGNAMREEIALVFQQNMADIGVMVVLEFEQAMVFFQDGPEGPVFGRRFDLAEFAWLSSYLPSLDLFYCSQIPSDENDWSGQNATGWCDPEFDRVGRKAERELERDSALASYYEAQRLFAEGLPILPLFMRVNVMATAPDVVNFYPDPTVASETWNIEEWAFGG